MPIDLRIAISFVLPLTSKVMAAMMLNAATSTISVKITVITTFCILSTVNMLWFSVSQSMT